MICSNRAKKTLTRPTKEKILKPKTAELFEVIFIDFCGPLKTTISGKRYILVIIDQFSRYVSLNAVARQDEQTTVDIIKNKWILKFGAPKFIHCDKGKSFESNLVKSLANILTGWRLFILAHTITPRMD